MKKIFIFINLLIGVHLVNAQQIELGIKAGINVGRGSLSDISNGTALIPATIDNVTGFNGGVYGRFKIILVGLYLQPELVLNTRNGVYNFNDGGKNFHVTNNTTYLDVPVLVGFKIVKIFRVYAGPNFQFLLSQNTTLSDQSISGLSRKNLDKSNTGLQVGVGLDLWKLRLDAKWDWNPTSMGSFMQYNNSSPNLTNSMFTFQLGYKLWGIL